MTIMFICTGNTCRSPMAEGIARDYLFKKGIENVKVSSAGLSPNENSRATEYAIEVMKEVDIFISEHLSNGITYRTLSEVDYFVPMTEEHKGVLMAAGVDRNKIVSFTRPVADPFGGDLYDYRRCRDQLIASVPSIIEKIIG